MFLSTEERLDPDLNWEVLQQPLFTANGEEVITHQQLINSQTGKQISVMPKTYKPYFNELFSEKVQEIANNTDLQFCGYHVYKEDTRLIAVFKSQDMEVLGQEHKRYIGLMNSHDGSHTIKLLQNLVMKRCTNGLVMIKGEANFHIMHTKNSHYRMNYQVQKVIQGFDDSLKTYLQDAQSMTKQKIQQRHVDFLLNEMKGADSLDKSTRMSNLIQKMQKAYSIESEALGNNSYAFLHAMTRYANENLQKNSGFASFYGTAATHNKKAYYLALNAMQLYKAKIQEKLLV